MFMKKYISRGFTLIELLVVIAIIGLLSSVVLASLNTARGKGADASIKTNLKSLQSQAELIFDSNSPPSYDKVCTGTIDTTITNQIANAKSAAAITAATNATLATAGSNTTATCHAAADNSAYAMEVPLKTDASKGWCVDSTGTSKQVTAHLGTSAVTCP